MIILVENSHHPLGRVTSSQEMNRKIIQKLEKMKCSTAANEKLSVRMFLDLGHGTPTEHLMPPTMG